MMLAARFGLNVRHVREERGMSQDAFSDLSGLHRTYLSGIERGIRNPTLSVVQRIADALKVPAAILLYEGE